MSAQHLQLVPEATDGSAGPAMFAPPWVSYVALLDGEPVGTCGFKAAPDTESVEIAYFTFPGFEGCGVATEMTGQLLSLADAAHPHVLVVAQTMTERNASHRVLEKHGFDCIATIHHPDEDPVLEWQRPAQAA